MEETNNVFSSLAGLEGDITLPQLSHMQNLNPSPPSIQQELKTPTVEAVLLSLVATAPVPVLINSPITNTDLNAKIESKDQSSGLKFQCSKCLDIDKSFKSEQALFGHMRMHSNKGCNGFKRPPIPKPKSHKLIPVASPSIYCPFTVTWSVTKKRGWKPFIDRNSPEVSAAFILMDMSNGTWTNDLQEESRTPLSELANKVGSTSLPSHQTQEKPPSSLQREQSNVSICAPTGPKSGAKRKAKDGLHECEICGRSFKKGQALGGHKRYHYKGELRRRYRAKCGDQ
ncbi:Zinc finger family protein [Rhynchospora pubera]|uniref:Zinc finger family protein n=1 Tax=Rhynchospora pubera TaxID=906938 RepID=A0AAV8E6K2_9POAL|nr:Zinc finger family protein [Rhynchospora pubera]